MVDDCRIANDETSIFTSQRGFVKIEDSSTGDGDEWNVELS